MSRLDDLLERANKWRPYMDGNIMDLRDDLARHPDLERLILDDFECVVQLYEQEGPEEYEEETA